MPSIAAGTSVSGTHLSVSAQARTAAVFRSPGRIVTVIRDSRHSMVLRRSATTGSGMEGLIESARLIVSDEAWRLL